MAVLRKGRGVATADLRTALAEHLREVIASSAWRNPPAERRLARLDAGEPVEVPGWLLWRWLPQWRREPLVRIDPNGTVVPVGPGVAGIGTT